MTRPHQIPAAINAHSHAFQRRLRGVAERPSASPRDDFWTWREVMYALAESLDPDSMRAAALETYREMRAAGYGAVGEFHYVHHQPDGTPYDDPNAMAQAVCDAAREAGIAIVLLPAAYHRGGHPRFRDPSVEAFLERVDALRAAGVTTGIAAHSVRAVPEDWLRAIAEYSAAHNLVRHVHACEQPREVEECRAEHGCTPIELLHRTGFLGPTASVVHGVHVSERDIGLITETQTILVSCPTTEGNLGDGLPPLVSYREAGARLAIGSDSQVRIDPFEEVRELETCARRAELSRDGLLGADGDLWGRLAIDGALSLGLPEPECITVDLDHPTLAGVALDDLPWALATCASAAAVIG